MWIESGTKNEEERNELESLLIHSYIVFVDNEYGLWVKILKEIKILEFYRISGITQLILKTFKLKLFIVSNSYVFFWYFLFDYVWDIFYLIMIRMSLFG